MMHRIQTDIASSCNAISKSLKAAIFYSIFWGDFCFVFGDLLLLLTGDQ